MKKVLHIFPYTIFAINYVRSFDNDEKRKHIFYLYGDTNILSASEIKFDKEPEVVVENDIVNIPLLKECLKGVDDIVIQCLPEKETIATYLMNYIRENGTRFVVYPWGRELYRTSDFYKHSTKDIVMKVDEAKEYFVKKCDAIIISENGYKYVTEVYKTECEYRIVFNAIRVVSDDEIVGIWKNSDGAIIPRVLVGHRGTRSSCHFDGFKYLSELKQKIKVICPLAIGEKEYIEEVIEKGCELFGNNFCYLREWIPKEEYYRYLVNNVDIGIFPTITSEAIVTILFLIGHGVKVYINPESDTYWLFKELGFIVFPFVIGEIDNSSLSPLTESEKRINERIALRYTSLNEFKEKWDNVLTYCENIYVNKI